MSKRRDNDTQITPPLKWAGGKRRLVPVLRRLWEGHSRRRLVEPFCGGLSVALGLRPERALLNDINAHLVNFYRQIARDGLPVTINCENSRGAYDAARQTFNDLIARGEDQTALAAQLFYYLNRTGFNGLCRFNRRGFFNVPFGRYKTINYARDFAAHREAFAPWEFECGDFSALGIEPSDFIYADPPYDVEFTTYSAGGFSWADQVRCAEWLAAHPGPVVLSNQATLHVKRLYSSLGFEIEEIEVERRISCSGDRTPAREVLATRNLHAAEVAPIKLPHAGIGLSYLEAGNLQP